MNYITIQKAQKNPSLGEVNENPSMTIEGEHQEMKDILKHAMSGQEIPRTDAQYFAPDDIRTINSLFRASLDLTDLDALRQKTSTMKYRIDKAWEKKQAEEAQKQQELEDAQAENQSETETTGE